MSNSDEFWGRQNVSQKLQKFDTWVAKGGPGVHFGAARRSERGRRGTFGGLEELVKLVKLGIGQKVLGIWNWAFDKNYNVHLARTAPRRGRGRRI